ncbi:MAG: exonuclease domain-containing protein [Actinobacteria bacterium]|nr:exonuclease domain-containing protein [Actinomycetota bacterium]
MTDGRTGVQLQLSLHLADDLYDLLLMTGEPVDYLEAARRLLALRAAPADVCRPVMAGLVAEDRRFCWTDSRTIGLADWKLADPDLGEVAFVVVDLETTGTRPGDGKITEIGAVRIEGLREVAHFETLVNPLRSIPPKVVEITGITPRMVRGAPRIEEVMPHFLDFLRNAVIVAHNAPFDLSFLNYELARLKGRRLGDGAIDTVSLARHMAPGLPNYRLGTVAEALGSPVAPVHRALADARATAHIFLTLISPCPAAARRGASPASTRPAARSTRATSATGTSWL